MKAFTYHEEDGFTVIQIPGNLSQGDWLEFRHHINRQFIDKGMIKLIFDCELLQIMPSIAFGALTCLSRDIRRMCGTLCLIHVNEASRRIIVRIRLDSALPIYGTLLEVLQDKSAPQP